MKTIPTTIATALILLMAAFSTRCEVHASEPVPIIFDTDIGNDIDDVMALFMIHNLQTRRECKLLAVTISKDHKFAAPYTDAINTFCGRADIPIGVCKSKVTPHEGKFIGLSKKKEGGKFLYPHDLKSGDDAPDAVAVLRKALANEKDGSVVIAQVGFSTNLANLLNSKSDEISSLSGMELVKKKVKFLSLMAGAFEKIKGKTGHMYDHKEYNVVKDIPAAQKITNDWPTEMIWSGFEIGITVRYPHESIEKDYRYVKHHPLPESYILYNPPPHDRPTWDLTSVLYGIRPERNYFSFSETGTVTVEKNGLTTFKADAKGKHRYMKLNDVQRSRLVEAMVLLSSEPPK